MESILLIIGLIIGIISCLFGLKFQKAILAIIGFVLGFTVGDYIVGLLSLTGGLDLVVKFGTALVFGVFSFSVFESFLALIVAIGIFIVVCSVFDSSIIGYIVGGIAGIVGGLLTHKFYKFGVILFTSITGAYLVSNFLINYIDFSYYIIFGIIVVISFLFQSFTNKIFN